MPTICTVMCPKHLAAIRMVENRAVDLLRASYDLIVYHNRRAWVGCDCGLMAKIEALLAEDN